MCLTTWTAHIIEDTTLLEALHVQLVTDYRFLEVGRLDSTLSVFVIVRTKQTLSLSTIVYMEVQWDAHLESQEQGWQAESVNAS